MQTSSPQGVLDYLRKLTDPVHPRDLSDADLLDRFRLRREEAAFTLLVQRHGPMVLNVCHRMLGDVHDAEDAFQATFLVLVRKAGTIRKQQSLAGWLHRVASRIAHEAGVRSVGRRYQPADAGRSPILRDDPSDTLAAAELRAALDEEIERLPDKYRTPLVLCYLAEKSHEQVAAELGWPKSSVTARLARARDLLQRRLSRRGFTVPAGLLAILLTEQLTNAAIPSSLALSTVRLAVQSLAGETLTATSAAVLAGSFVKGTAARNWTAALAMLATLSIVAAGYRMAVSRSSSPPEQSASKAQAIGERREPRVDSHGDALPDEAVARMGSNRLRHSSLHTLFFSSDSKNLFSLGHEDFRIWDAATGKLLRRFASGLDLRISSCRQVGDSIVCAAADGKFFVTVQVLDAASGKVRRQVRIKEQSSVLNPLVSPDGKSVAIMHRDSLGLYDTATGETVQRLPSPSGFGRVAFAPDSKTIAFNAPSTDTICLHDVATGKLIRELKRPSAPGVGLHFAFSPDGQFLASMTQRRGVQKGEVSIWNVRDDKEGYEWAHPFKQPLSQACAAAFSPDGKRIAIGGGTWGLVVNDVQTGKEIHRLTPLGGVRNIAFAPDGKTIATASEGAIRLWDAVTGRLLPASADAEVQVVDRVRFSGDGKRLFGDAAACLVWDAATGREIRRFVDPKTLDFKFPQRLLVLSPDESLLAFGSREGTITLRNAAAGEDKRTLQGLGTTWRPVFAPNSRQLLSGGSDNLVRLWDVASGRELRRMPGRTPLAVSADGRLLAATDATKGTPSVLLYDLAGGRELRRFAFPNPGQLLGLAFSSDSRTFIAVGRVGLAKYPGIAHIWDVQTGALKHSFVDRPAILYSAAFSPDGRSVALGDARGGLSLWELAGGRLRHTFVGHESRISSLAFSRDSRRLAASSPDAPVYVWDISGSLRSASHRLSKEELQHSWNALAGEDAASAFQAMRHLAAKPEKALPFLRQHLKPVPVPESKHIRRLVGMLDSADFSTRQKATEELEKKADAAAGLVRQILAKEKPSLEVRQRLQQILEGIDSKFDTLRAVRAVELLEWIATPEAVGLIGELAGGAADARLTRDAVAAKRRLAR